MPVNHADPLAQGNRHSGSGVRVEERKHSERIAALLQKKKLPSIQELPVEYSEISLDRIGSYDSHQMGLLEMRNNLSNQS